MSKIIYIKNDKSSLFVKMVNQNAALAIDSMVSNIERNSKMQVPVRLTKAEGGNGKSSGQLRSSFLGLELEHLIKELAIISAMRLSKSLVEMVKE